VHILQQKTQEHCGKGISNEACLLELEWYTKEVVVLYLVYKKYGKQGYHVKENRGQGVISRRKLEELKWCGCLKKEERKAVHPTKGNAQQKRRVSKGRSGKSSKC